MGADIDTNCVDPSLVTIPKMALYDADVDHSDFEIIEPFAPKVMN